MKKQFTMSVTEIVKETIVAFITYMVMSCICCAIAWPILKWSDKRRKAQRGEGRNSFSRKL